MVEYIGLFLKDIPESKLENIKNLVKHHNATILSEERKGNYTNLVISAKEYRGQEIKEKALSKGYASKIYRLDDSGTNYDYVMGD